MIGETSRLCFGAQRGQCCLQKAMIVHCDFCFKIHPSSRHSEYCIAAIIKYCLTRLRGYGFACQKETMLHTRPLDPLFPRMPLIIDPPSSLVCLQLSGDYEAVQGSDVSFFLLNLPSNIGGSGECIEPKIIRIGLDDSTNARPVTTYQR